ncbi:MAG TPA: antibiotic biosynthesis monooxygenase [Rhodothermales bacterium]|nr:antibiotic biosynthesis monooxygenase [Bacteroidota bacterium]HRK73004.1 antibiotic biosynthesis monooxygenase [Rhodothermales bacterium]HRR09077.1 antibiotic biosynthesis monooxygenase [Rhodothermales bacterium]
MNGLIAPTPKPPYYAVIFTNILNVTPEGYRETAERMVALAAEYKGFLGAESARDGLGITVSYWDSLAAIHAWKSDAEHRIAQEKGRNEWYSAYKTRVCLVERDYGFGIEEDI